MTIRRLVAWSLLLAVASISSVVATDVDPKRVKQASRACVKAERSLKAGALDKAAEQFEEALELQPGFPNAHIGLGHVAMARSTFDEALSHYRTAREQFERFGEAALEVQAKRYRSARSDITALRDQINNMLQNSTSIRTQQTVYQIENQIAQLEVIEPPDESSTGQPPAEFDFYLGNALFQLQRLDEAVEAWERCRDAKPKFAMVYNNLALVYWKQGRLEEAVAALETADELGFPVNPDFKRDLTAAAAEG